MPAAGGAARPSIQPASATTAIARATRAKVTRERILSTSTITARMTVADTVRVTSILSKQTAPGSRVLASRRYIFRSIRDLKLNHYGRMFQSARGARPSQVQPRADQQQRQPDQAAGEEPGQLRHRDDHADGEERHRRVDRPVAADVEQDAAQKQQRHKSERQPPEHRNA